MRLVELVCLAQGVYFAATGLLPFVSMRAFERITGPKLEHWLVRTVGAVVTVVGGVLILAAVRGHTCPEVAALAIGSAGALALVDVNYVARGRIAPVYLADAAAELLLIAGWIVALVA